MVDESTTLQDDIYWQSRDSSIESDEALAERGGAEDFISLYRRYLRSVYGYLYAQVGGNRQEAEDVTALAFERAWASLGTYKPTGSFKGWLFTIVARALADYHRSNYRSKGGKPQSLYSEELQASLLDPSLSPEENVILADQLHRILKVVAALGREQHEIIFLRFIADLKYSEIAVVMKKREAAVKMMAYRALEAIRRRYKDGEF